MNPPAFQRALDTLQAILAGPGVRPELDLEEMPAPQSLAPYAAAMSGSVYRDDDTEVAMGRLIVLYDPDGRGGWTNDFRIVAYIRADLEPDIAADELIGSVAWDWLLEALEPAGYAGVSGTITRAVSESFGDKRGEPSTTELELRASWSPTGDDLAPHVAAWCEVMCTTAGLPPSGVAALPDRPGGAGG
ncbi:Protein of unknown function (DUF3000) [Actinomadura pelletieri DSM 43383]|uniref:DUF3000 domain-containing protein n=2 Tax=Actinomadura TaxID=1988 RepID=A0A372GBS4_9ACTN|nr:MULTISPECIES: DUF3000 domain-containing protein [Actinomadura]RFS82797.1 DUF3000 domain-containing protein [Actinomadura spongiicola]RKS68895.1 Protein of unknown function (DUF3000) [Actinomadura pelletieri DSM 43383]